MSHPKLLKVLEALNFVCGREFTPEIVLGNSPLLLKLGASGGFRRPNTIYLLEPNIRTFIHEYCHLLSYRDSNPSILFYTSDCPWSKRSEEQLAIRMTKLLVPLVKLYLRGKKRDLKKKWRQKQTSVRGQLINLAQSIKTHEGEYL